MVRYCNSLMKETDEIRIEVNWREFFMAEHTSIGVEWTHPATTYRFYMWSSIKDGFISLYSILREFQSFTVPLLYRWLMFKLFPLSVFRVIYFVGMEIYDCQSLTFWEFSLNFNQAIRRAVGYRCVIGYCILGKWDQALVCIMRDMTVLYQCPTADLTWQFDTVEKWFILYFLLPALHQAVISSYNNILGCDSFQCLCLMIEDVSMFSDHVFMYYGIL